MGKYIVCVVNKDGAIKETNNSITLSDSEGADPGRHRTKIVNELFRLYDFNVYTEYYRTEHRNNGKDIAIVYDYPEGRKDTWLLKLV